MKIRDSRTPSAIMHLSDHELPTAHRLLFALLPYFILDVKEVLFILTFLQNKKKWYCHVHFLFLKQFKNKYDYLSARFIFMSLRES